MQLTIFENDPCIELCEEVGCEERDKCMKQKIGPDAICIKAVESHE